MRTHARSVLTAAIAAGLGLGLGLGLSACGDSPALDQPEVPKPARTPPPTRAGEQIAWVGLRYSGLRFHSVQRAGRGPVFAVHYGEPLEVDTGSGREWHFALTVVTAPRREETRRRVRRSLGAGVPVRRGTRYGCRRPGDRARIVVLTATQRFELTGGSCATILRASQDLRRA
jgi:hypothetical protein